MSTFISLYVKCSYITCRIKLYDGRQVSFLTKSKLNQKKFDRKKKFEAIEKQKTGKKRIIQMYLDKFSTESKASCMRECYFMSVKQGKSQHMTIFF